MPPVAHARIAHPPMVSRRTRIAILGGDGRFDKSSLPNSRVRVYPGRRFGGNGPLKKLIASIKAGGVDRVVILASCVGHSADGRVRRLCAKRGVPCELRS